MANTRRCPFFGCKRMIDGDFYACRVHWPTLNDEDRFTLMTIWNEYKAGRMHIDEFTERQAVIQLKNTPQAVPGAIQTKGSELIDLAKVVANYIRLRKEYTAVKDQMLDRKRKVGIELSKAEVQVKRMVDAILHPPQTQLTLFDNPANEQQQQMPD